MPLGVRRLADAQGFGAPFAALQRLRTGYGDPAPDDLLSLPTTFRREVLGVATDNDGDLAHGLGRLIELVDASPRRERDLLRVAFNFDREFGNHVWTARVQDFAQAHGGEERRVRELVDTAILQLLLRTREAAEKLPDPQPTENERPTGRGGTGRTASFFDQDYVRNSQAFAAAWSRATSVEMCGFGHNRMLVAYSAEIVGLLKNDGRLRVLLQDPEGTGVISANQRSSTPKASDEAVRHQHRAGLAMLRSLPTLAGGHGRVEVRAYDVMPPFTGYFFDSDREDAEAFIWFWSWRQASSWRPGFRVERKDDPLWHDRFFAQFQAMWSDDDTSIDLEF